MARADFLPFIEHHPSARNYSRHWEYSGDHDRQGPCSNGVLKVVGEMKVKVAQSCLTLCDPMDATAHGILQARILEWVAFLFARGSSQPRDRTQVTRIAGGFFTS